MNNRNCDEFQSWLERLPRSELSPAFREHLRECDTCARNYHDLVSLVDMLNEASHPVPLESDKIDTISREAKKQMIRRKQNRTMTGITLIGFLCLPLLVLINGTWALLGYFFFKAYISTVAAQVYIVMFLITTTLFMGLSYGFLPLVTGWLKTQATRETML